MPHFPQIENECKRTFSFWEAYEEKLGSDAHHDLVSFLKSFEYTVQLGSFTGSDTLWERYQPAYLY